MILYCCLSFNSKHVAFYCCTFISLGGGPALVLISISIQVKNFISLGGPHAGTASVPLCGVYVLPIHHFLFLDSMWIYLKKFLIQDHNALFASPKCLHCLQVFFFPSLLGGWVVGYLALFLSIWTTIHQNFKGDMSDIDLVFLVCFDIVIDIVFCLQSGIFCIIADALIKSEVYSDYVQV